MKHFDLYNILFAYFTEGKSEQTLKLSENHTRSIVNIYLSIYEHKSPMKGKNALNFVEIIQARLKKELEDIISKKGIYYWFHLYRRIPPFSVFRNDSKMTTLLYRNILETAFVKYGKLKCGNELLFIKKGDSFNIEELASGNFVKAYDHYIHKKYVPNENDMEGIFLGEFDYKDFVEIHILERLAYEYWHTTVCIRRINKGGVLEINNNRYFVINDYETEELMKFYDNRDQENVTTSGILLEGNINVKGTTFIPSYNVGQISTNQYPFHTIFHVDSEFEDFIPNFLWTPFDFMYYYQVHECYKDSFYKQFGYSLECFVMTLFLILIDAIISCLDDPRNPYALMKNAYQHHLSKTDYINKIVDHSHDTIIPSLLFNYNLKYEEVEKVLSNFEATENREDISLTTLGPRILLIPSVNGGFVIDFVSIRSILLSQTHFLDVDGNAKGHLFEDAVIEKMQDKEMRLWECKKHLKHSDGTEKELDISFLYKNILFIGELKCNKMSMSFTIGDEKALEHRKKKILCAIDEINKKADWLLTHKEGTNYSIPKNIELIVPIVVTPFNEYIWSKNSSLWITENIPRICRSGELSLLCTDATIHEIMHRPFTRIIK